MSTPNRTERFSEAARGQVPSRTGDRANSGAAGPARAPSGVLPALSWRARLVCLAAAVGLAWAIELAVSALAGVPA